MEAKTDTRRHLGAQAWREMFRRFDGSGDSVVGFCKREGLNASGFHRRRRRLAIARPQRVRRKNLRKAARQSAAANRLEVASDITSQRTLRQ